MCCVPPDFTAEVTITKNFVADSLQKCGIPGTCVSLKLTQFHGASAKFYQADFEANYGSHKESIQLVLKIGPISHPFSDPTMLHREQHFYTEIAPSKVSLRTPKCYGALSNNHSSILILEDLNANTSLVSAQYKQGGFPRALVLSAALEFASFHAEYWANPLLFPAHCSEGSLHWIPSVNSQQMCDYTVRKTSKEFQEHLDAYKVVLDSDTFEFIYNLTSRLPFILDKLGPTNCKATLVHCDAFPANIFFREQSTVLSKRFENVWRSSITPAHEKKYMLYAVDWATVSVASSGVIDLITLIDSNYLCGTPHEQEIKDAYFQELKYWGISERDYSKEEFEQEYTYAKIWSLAFHFAALGRYLRSSSVSEHVRKDLLSRVCFLK